MPRTSASCSHFPSSSSFLPATGRLQQCSHRGVVSTVYSQRGTLGIFTPLLSWMKAVLSEKLVAEHSSLKGEGAGSPFLSLQGQSWQLLCLGRTWVSLMPQKKEKLPCVLTSSSYPRSPVQRAHFSPKPPCSVF